ncbi:MAG: hypothetical protein UT22_C0044G0004 [Parcubacteria group bacterium GW2011_GWC2_39_11]|nr:MAG: hypothetical protein UT22_C0044G0004 [Parcubacteria group bacterium GW2011_GWC2_39_11]
METQEYLSDKLKNCTSYDLTTEDKKLLDDFGVEEFIYKKLTSKKFRKWSLAKDVKERIRQTIHLNVGANQPIEFRFPFGGYKLWRLPTTPEVDWAEFFTIAYYCQYLAPILKAYKPGVSFIFSSDDIIIERMDNVSKKDTDAYFDSFKTLLGCFQKHFPSNMKMEIMRIADLYPNKNDFEAELKERISQITEDSKSWDKAEWDKLLKMSELNIKFIGVEDWASLSEEEKQDKIKAGVIYHHSYISVPRRRAYNRGEGKIVVFTTVIPNAIAIGTTKTSVTKFWTGVGVLEMKENGFSDRILSPEQWGRVKDTKHEIVNLDVISLKNFKQVRAFPDEFNFRH